MTSIAATVFIEVGMMKVDSSMKQLSRIAPTSAP